MHPLLISFVFMLLLTACLFVSPAILPFLVGLSLGAILIVPSRFQKKLSKNFSLRSLYTLALLVAAIPNALAWWRIERQGGFDIALYSQMLNSTIELGNSYLTIAHGADHLGYHLFLIIYPLAYIHNILVPFLPAFRFLMLTQLLSALFFVYVAFRHDSSAKKGEHDYNSAGQLATLVILCFWGVTSAANFEFHAETVGMYWASTGIITYLRRSKRIAVASFFIALLCGELFLISIPAIIAICHRMTLAKGHKLAVWETIITTSSLLVGVLILYRYVSHWGPLWLGPEAGVNKLMRFQGFATSFSEILLMPFLNLGKFIAHIVQPYKLWWLLGIGSLLVFPLFLALFALFGDRKSIKPSWNQISIVFLVLLSMSGPLAKVLLSTSRNLTFPQYHYLADLAPSLFLILVLLLSYILREQRLKNTCYERVSLRNPLVVFALCGLSMIYHPVDGWKKAKTLSDWMKAFPNEAKAYLLNIPTDKSVYLNDFNLSAVLAYRPALLTSHSPARLYDEVGLPDILVMGWAPTHGYDVANQSDFAKSFKKLSNKRVVSLYQGREQLYELSHVLRAFNRNITIWRKAQD